MFGSFSAFWDEHHVSARWAAVPSFADRDRAVRACRGGRSAVRADRRPGWGTAVTTRAVTGGAFLVAAAGFGLTLLQTRMWALVGGAICLDLAVQTTLVLGQRAIYALDPAARSRLNTLYIATFFCGGAAGSAISGIAYARAGWLGVAVFGSALPICAFALWLTDREPRPIR
jgi:predicted MFS family arabinose efflux permease